MNDTANHTLPEIATMDEKTVQKVARGEVPKVTKNRRNPKHRNSPVSVIKVNPLVMETALRLAKGDASRLRIESETSVLVN